MRRRFRVSAVVAVVGIVLACFTAPAAADDEVDGGADANAGAPPARSCIPAESCCKVCEHGQACGKSCISRAKVCHKPRGCACDAASVCS